jgi:tRNA(adenine34) deaminase
VPVGAVIVRGGEVVGAAHNRVDGSGDPTAHAEILAITQAARAVGDWRLNETTLYVTKEPCPMCSGAMLMARVGRVVYAVADPKLGCLGGATDLNALPRVNHHCEITPGILEAECRELLQAFFRLKRTEEQEKPTAATGANPSDRPAAGLPAGGTGSSGGARPADSGNPRTSAGPPFP